MAKLTESEYRLHKTTREVPDDRLRRQLKKVYLRRNGDETLTLMPGNESFGFQGLTVEEISERIRFLLPSDIPMLDDKVIEALVRTALGRRGKQTRLLDIFGT